MTEVSHRAKRIKLAQPSVDEISARYLSTFFHVASRNPSQLAVRLVGLPRPRPACTLTYGQLLHAVNSFKTNVDPYLSQAGTYSVGFIGGHCLEMLVVLLGFVV